MVIASEVREGMAIKLEDRIFKVLEVKRHLGSGQMQGFIDAKLKDIRSSHVSDRHFKFSDRLEEIDLARKAMDFLYSDNEACCFMDPANYEQIAVPRAAVGQAGKLLKQGMRIMVEFLDEEPVSIEFPKTVDLKVISTATGIKSHQDNTMKTAFLENDLEVLVPQFVEKDDLIRIDTEKLRYIERLKK